MKKKNIETINMGTLNVDVLSNLVLSFVVTFKESILQRFHRNETSIWDSGPRNPSSDSPKVTKFYYFSINSSRSPVFQFSYFLL
ncbi:hypothetical protein AKJ66_02675 [candidate division MSBL1 archaeon SCGC-AAA259E22]|uniref:Uncharacterized protein n=1 Tax=candidate division MSBL1 archaeon SCGC-AAA259E22 TaxID=1698265 RepID=A0A133UGD9_9EURY|nr:hypothetical protein AKJ66_02675 [candidate division MSBL1 archaeon SCGC-AAA259E22]